MKNRETLSAAVCSNNNKSLTKLTVIIMKKFLLLFIIAFNCLNTQASQYVKHGNNSKTDLTLTIRVKDGITGASIAYAGVYINELGATYIADQYGLATIGNLSPETEYNYIISAGTYNDAEGSVYMAQNNKFIIVYLYPPGYTATFKIKNADTNEPIEGASIMIQNTMYNLTTNSQGEASAVLPNNLEDYSYMLSCDGYIPKSGNTFHLYGSNVTVNNTMIPAYNLCLGFNGNGTITMNGSTYNQYECFWFDWNESVNLVATADEGWRFSAWEVYITPDYGPPELESTSDEPELNLVMNSDKMAVAIFNQIIEYPVTFTVTDGVAAIQNAQINIFDTNIYTNADGQAVINLEDRTYAYTITKDGYTTVNDYLTVNGAPLNVNIILSVPSQEKTLTLSFSGNGGATVNGLDYTEPITVPTGTQLTITAVPDPGYTFVTWSGDLWSTLEQQTITMDNDMNITATFTENTGNTYIVEFSVLNGNGSITATVDDLQISPGETVEENKNIIFTATPDINYNVKEWTVNDVVQEETGNELTYTNLQEDITVTVQFESAAGGISDFSGNKLLVYPNPSTGNFTINLSFDKGESIIDITDITGRKVNCHIINSFDNISVDFSNNPSGIYIIVIKKDDKIFRLKIIKE